MERMHLHNDYVHIFNPVVPYSHLQSERIMEENSMVRDLITKILDETGPSDGFRYVLKLLLDTCSYYQMFSSQKAVDMAQKSK